MKARVVKFGGQFQYFSEKSTLFPPNAPINTTNTLEIRCQEKWVKGKAIEERACQRDR
jgi:hypothetical protein